MRIGNVLLVLVFITHYGTLGLASEPVRLRHPFEAAETTWNVAPTVRSVVVKHARSDVDHRSGLMCEQVNFQSPVAVLNTRLEHELPQARVFDELKLSVWVRSNCPNLRLGLQVLFPHQKDPRTGELLVLDVFGEHYTAGPEWQQLTCHTTDALIEQRIIRAREEFSNGVDVLEIDSRDMIVRAAILVFDVPGNPSGILIDDLELGPIVDLGRSVTEILPVQATAPVVAPVRLLVGDRITKDDEPFFPVFTIHHGEPVELMAGLGINMLWVPDYQDQQLLLKLSQNNIGTIAVPPHPTRDQALEQSAALPRFSDATTPVWAWMLGAQIPPAELGFVEAWAAQVRDADRDYRRPLMCEVLSNQRAFHRTTTFLGSTRLPMQTSLSPAEALRRAQRNRALALPGKATFTFIDTEPAAQTIDARPAGTPFPALEPEQILAQSFAAIAAGYRGLGFWKQYPLTDNAPGMSEREQAIRLACIEARLLEDFLASSRVVRELAVQIGDESPQPRSRLAANNPFTSRWDSVRLASGEVVSPLNEARSLKAYLLQSDVGFMVLPLWLEEGAQFVPGPQLMHDVRFLLPPGTTAAWEVTTTGINSQIELTPVAGGMEAHLEEMSLFSVIIATHSRTTLDEIRNRSRLYREEAANSWIRLTEAKLERTRTVDSELQQVGAPPIPNGASRLASADALLARARKQLERGSFDGARQDCERALQYVRMVQRQHWSAAVEGLTSPVASPYTISYQTLPTHWQLMAEIGQRSSQSANLLQSGSFEDETVFVRSGWEDRTQSLADTAEPVDQARISLESVGVVGRSALVLDAPYHGRTEATRHRPLVPARLVSPAIEVGESDIVLITGQIRIPQPLEVSDEGFLFYDSLYGESAALRWTTATSGWQSFRIVRHVRTAADLQLHLELHGRGRVELDDLQVIVIANPVIANPDMTNQ